MSPPSAPPTPGATPPVRDIGPGRALRSGRAAAALCLLALGGCAISKPVSVCAREANNDPQVQALQMQMLGNVAGTGLMQPALDAARDRAETRCEHRLNGTPTGGVAPTRQPLGTF